MATGNKLHVAKLEILQTKKIKNRFELCNTIATLKIYKKHSK
jgi:hypothetical protein